LFDFCDEDDKKRIADIVPSLRRYSPEAIQKKQKTFFEHEGTKARRKQTMNTNLTSR
jgi:hypothetical protein